MSASRRDFLKAVPAAIGAGVLHAQSGNYVTAETTFGKLRGVDAQGIKVFKGVPYGASTAGANRFMPPRDPQKWTGVRDAFDYGQSAPQSNPGVPRNGGALSVSGASLPAEGEDCLVLNVWTPGIQDGHKRPVMFWCHGGGFASGSGSSPITQGENLARRGDVVVITINHRLNVLGFTALGEFSRDFASSGDVGMLDIVHALKWVHANAAHFGGDAGNVMIFGQSGGGRKVETLLAMPSAKGLFHRAAIESGAAMELVSRDNATRVGEQLLRKLDIPKEKVHDVQKLPVDRIMSAYFAILKESPTVDQMTAGFSPEVDGKILSQNPFQPNASPISADVPVLIGSTRTEMTLFHLNDPSVFTLDESGMRARASKLLGSDAERMIAVYKKTNPGASASDLFLLIETDHRYGAPTMKIAERRAALGKGPVYLYYFTWETPVMGGKLKSPHTMEIPFVFHNVKIAERLTGGDTPATMALSDRVSDAWLAFARTGDPNTPKLPHWPKFDAQSRATMVLNNECKVVNDPLREQRLAMFEALKFTS